MDMLNKFEKFEKELTKPTDQQQPPSASREQRAESIN